MVRYTIGISYLQNAVGLHGSLLYASNTCMCKIIMKYDIKSS